MIKIKCFKLYEDAGDGKSSNFIARVADEADAHRWEESSLGWRSYCQAEIVIFDSLEEFEQDKKEKVAIKILNSLKPEELAALKEHFNVQ